MRKSILTVVFLLFMPLVAALLNSCKTCGGDWDVYESLNHKVKPVAIVGTNASGDQYEVATYSGQSLPYDSIGLEISYDIQQIGSLMHRHAFMNTAYACDPRPPYDYIHTFKVFSNRDYDAAHPAGTDLTDILSFASNLEVSPPWSFPDFSLNDSRFLVRFTEAPDVTDSHELTIQMGYYSLGQPFITLSVDPIQITP